MFAPRSSESVSFARRASLSRFTRLPCVALMACALALPSGAAFADTVALKADLEPSSEVPPHVSHGHGMLDASFDTSSKALHWTATYAELSTPVTAAHFHGPAPVGQNAKVQIAIDKRALPSPIKGTATLTDAQAADLMSGQWYFNVHTTQNPGGEIRGQVRPVN